MASAPAVTLSRRRRTAEVSDAAPSSAAEPATAESSTAPTVTEVSEFPKLELTPTLSSSPRESSLRSIALPSCQDDSPLAAQVLGTFPAPPAAPAPPAWCTRASVSPSAAWSRRRPAVNAATSSDSRTISAPSYQGLTSIIHYFTRVHLLFPCFQLTGCCNHSKMVKLS